MTDSTPGAAGPVGYDAEHVMAMARGADPGMPEEVARELAVLAGDHLADMGSLDAPELARRLLADLPRAGASPAAVVARSAVQLCTERGLQS